MYLLIFPRAPTFDNVPILPPAVITLFITTFIVTDFGIAAVVVVVVVLVVVVLVVVCCTF